MKRAKSKDKRAKSWRLGALARCFLACTLGLALIKPASGQEHTLNLQNADIRALVTTVGDITGKTFVVDPRVTGEVSVVSSEPMGPEEIYQVFLSVLSVHGLMAIPSGEVIKIVPESGARAGPLMGEGAPPDALVTRIVKPDHVSAAQLEPLLRPLLPPQARLTVFAPANLLIVTDRAGNVERLARIVERVDTATANAKVEVIRLQHASAAEVVRLINQLYPQAVGTTPSAVADQRTNTILLSGDPATRLRMKTLIVHLDTPLETGGATRVVYLDYASAAELVPILQSVSQALSGTVPAVEGEAPSSETSIQAHPATNALVITATPSVFSALESVIRRLDIRRSQVLVEGIIAEVSVDKAKELGVQWQATSDFDGDGIIGGTNFGGPGSNILGLSVDPTQAAPGLNLGYLSGTVTIPGTEETFFQLGALLRALQSDASSNVLSTPSLVTLDNQEAEIQVGQEVPFITGQFLPGGADTGDGFQNPFQTIQRDEVGITLTVTPHINQGDTVRMDIEQEVSSIAASSLQGAVDLITNKRTLSTSVLVESGEILVLGGLIDENVQETQQSVPLLGDIPLLGNLFRYRTSSTVKRNLMIFVQPTILRDPGTANAVTGGKYRYIRAQQMQARQDEDNLTPPENMPLLPELYEYLGPADRVEPDPDDP